MSCEEKYAALSAAVDRQSCVGTGMIAGHNSKLGIYNKTIIPNGENVNLLKCRNPNQVHGPKKCWAVTAQCHEKGWEGGQRTVVAQLVLWN